MQISNVLHNFPEWMLHADSGSQNMEYNMSVDFPQKEIKALPKYWLCWQTSLQNGIFTPKISWLSQKKKYKALSKDSGCVDRP